MQYIYICAYVAFIDDKRRTLILPKVIGRDDIMMKTKILIFTAIE